CSCTGYTDKAIATTTPRIDAAAPTQAVLIAPEVDATSRSDTPAVFWRKDRPGWWSCFLEMPRGPGGKRRRKRISAKTPDEVRTKYAIALRELDEHRLASGG